MGITEDRLRELTDEDLHFLVTSVTRRRTDYEKIVDIIRDKPDLIDVILDDPQVCERLYNDRDLLLQVSPFLLFTALLRRAHRELKESVFTMEVAHEGRLPVFDARDAASLLDDPGVRNYLARMLSSFTRTDTATVVFRGRRGLVRRTYSDLDVDDMLELSEMVEESHRLPFFKRAADVCLFLTGMFPENLVPWTGGRAQSSSVRTQHREQRSLSDYEAMGKEFYLKAADLSNTRAGEGVDVLRSLADAFTLARKPLGLIAEYYIPHQRRQWFDPGLESENS